MTAASQEHGCSRSATTLKPNEPFDAIADRVRAAFDDFIEEHWPDDNGDKFDPDDFDPDQFEKEREDVTFPEFLALPGPGTLAGYYHDVAHTVIAHSLGWMVDANLGSFGLTDIRWLPRYPREVNQARWIEENAIIYLAGSIAEAMLRLEPFDGVEIALCRQLCGELAQLKGTEGGSEFDRLLRLTWEHVTAAWPMITLIASNLDWEPKHFTNADNKPPNSLSGLSPQDISGKVNGLDHC